MIIKANHAFKIFAIIFLFGCISIDVSAEAFGNNFEEFVKKKYDELVPLENTKPSFDLFRRGMIGYYGFLADSKELDNQKLTLIDFRLSSTKKRMWIIDLDQNKVLYYRLVAHGKNTGEEYARHFSNVKNSNKSSLGFYLTGENYMGKHGLSLRLDGLEPGFNDKARSRAIVMHSANYVSRDFIKIYGRLGRSFGCPAIALKDHKEIIRGLANKSLLFIYYPHPDYEAKTTFNNLKKAQKYFESQSIYTLNR